MRTHETAKEFLRDRLALRRDRPFTPIQQFQETIGVTTPFNEHMPDACRLGPAPQSTETANG